MVQLYSCVTNGSLRPTRVLCPKWHLYQFSRFHWAHDHERQIDRPHNSVCGNKPRHIYLLLWCSLKICNSSHRLYTYFSSPGTELTGHRVCNMQPVQRQTYRVGGWAGLGSWLNTTIVYMSMVTNLSTRRQLTIRSNNFAMLLPLNRTVNKSH